MANLRPKFPIVGVGASTGGVEALEGFFKGLPPQPGLGFVLVSHLSPDRESLLHEIIARYTDLTVVIAEHGLQVRANCVYVLSVSSIISLKFGRLQLRTAPSGQRERRPIDILFSSLAVDQEEYAASVVLSGGDSDGTLGTKAIKERGGLTLAQVADGHGPKDPSMPNSAISTGYVDFALPAGEMGVKLAAFARSLAEPGAEPAIDAGGPEPQAEISAIIRDQIGHDFVGYKSQTFFRRVQRRMHVVQATDQAGYIERLKSDPDEVGALFHDLLINVTNFFRDADAFETLRGVVIPKLFEGRGAQDAVRVWVPGCATGEEVYSLAMLLREHMDGLTRAPKVQLFATDIDEAALKVARAGRYPEALLEGLSAERRERFFVEEGGSYAVTKDLTEFCLFSPHSIIRDPPFSRLDLISCRNLLIYFGHEIQDQVLPTFHYALNEGGFLFLGQSESVGKFGDLFEPLDKKHRIFRSCEEVAGAPRLSLQIRRVTGAAYPESRRRTATEAAPRIGARQALEFHVLERFAPAHVLVSQDGDVVHFSARTSRYLELTAGAPTRQLTALARKELKLDLRSAFREAVETNRSVSRPLVTVTSDEGRIQRVRLTVEPLLERRHGPPLYVVVFTDEGLSLSRDDIVAISTPDSSEAVHLERELRDTKDRLQSLIEEYETALEELRSSNEELLSVNEELQSSNEELEVSKEEQQSLNEELNTVNAELLEKIDAVDRANGDLQNLFESTQIPTVFLDKDLAIRSYTPSVRELFNVLPTDRGRPLTDLSSRLSLPRLFEDIARVLEVNESVEREVSHPDTDRRYTLRIAPYRTLDGQIEGVVVTFIDVTRLTEAQAHQQTLIAELNLRVRTMLMGVIGIAQQTHRLDERPDVFFGSFIGRLQAMARTYELLSRENWTESSLEELVRTEVSPLGLDRVTIEGPPTGLTPRQALSLGMALHELATNAGKHGALSVPLGRLSIRWSQIEAQGKSHVELDWLETGGPPPAAGLRPSYGLTVIEREASYNLNGTSSVTIGEAGDVHGHLSFPLADG